MTPNRSNLILSSLDYDQILGNLKTYLKSQDQFKDYDFEGSGLSVLLQILAYNTHYQAYYANMVANETFLDSANKRESIVSISKHLDYIPKSYKSSTAYVDVEFLNLDLPENTSIKTSIENGNYFVLKGDRFTTSAGNRSYLFVCTNDVRVLKDGDRYFAKNVEIKEGEIKSITYVYDTNSNIDQKFIIPDLSVDIDSLDVRVIDSLESTVGVQNKWTRVNDLNKLTSESLVYFIQQNSDLKYEIYFGDGIVGKKPDSGNVIIINYRFCSGSEANGLGKYETDSSPTFTYGEFLSSKVLLIKDSNNNPSPTFGGSDLESMQSIKYYAPRNYQAQERAVTAEDYRVLLAREYGEQAESVFIWGGEDNDPPIYGKVFASIKPKNAVKLTQIQKLAIAKNILKERNIVSILPEIVDPDYLYLKLNIISNYDKNKTTLTPEVLSNTIKSFLLSYMSQAIGKFDRDFLESNLITYYMNKYNPPVLNCSISMKLEKRLEPNLTSITTYTINFDNALYHPIDGYQPILKTSSFGYQDSTSLSEIKPLVDAYLEDDGSGKIRIYKLLNGSKIIINDNIGTIDYSTGKITLVNFAPQYFTNESDTYITFEVIPNSNDVVSRRNQILLIENKDLTITMVPQTLPYDPYNASGAPFTGN